MAEGAPLLRECGLTPTEGSNPSLSARQLVDLAHNSLHNHASTAPVAQLDRASDYGSEGWGFESSPARQLTRIQ